jgi:transmembrane sensor
MSAAEERRMNPETSSPSWLEQGRLEQAGLWWTRLREPQLSPQDLAQWLDWCQQHPANLQAFERIEALGGQLSALASSTRAGLVRELLAEEVPRRRLRRRWLWPAAASIVLAAGLAAWATQWRPLTGAAHGVEAARVYATHKSESREVNLADGSHVAIGADSDLSVGYSDSGRNLELGKGEAYFEVEHDAQRPFIVRAGRLAVIAIGTAFNIRKTGERVEVTVTRGVVDVQDRRSGSAATAAQPRKGAIRVPAGQRVVAEAGDAEFKVRAADEAATLSWRSGSMAFLDEDLAFVVANLNRYTQHEVVIADPVVARLRFTGTLVQGHEQEWLEAIQRIFPVAARREADGRIALYYRPVAREYHGALSAAARAS